MGEVIAVMAILWLAGRIGWMLHRLVSAHAPEDA